MPMLCASSVSVRCRVSVARTDEQRRMQIAVDGFGTERFVDLDLTAQFGPCDTTEQSDTTLNDPPTHGHN
jgi:hypothetical protein